MYSMKLLLTSHLKTRLLNRSIFIKIFKTIINKFPTQKPPDPSVFTGKFHQILIEEIIQFSEIHFRN